MMIESKKYNRNFDLEADNLLDCLDTGLRLQVIEDMMLMLQHRQNTLYKDLYLFCEGFTQDQIDRTHRKAEVISHIIERCEEELTEYGMLVTTCYKPKE